jgi:hypothetical protein
MLKKTFTPAISLAILILCSSAISIGEVPQDPPRGKKAKKHINLVKIDDDGNKIQLDTVIEGEQVFVWNGDTIGEPGKMTWISKGGEFEFDEDMDFDFDVKTNGKAKFIVMKDGNMTAPQVFEFKTDDDSVKQYRVQVIASDDDEDVDVMKWHIKKGENAFFGDPQTSRKMMFISNREKENVIDLSDPGIISYEKKELKNGREKIVIVREKPSEEDKEMNEEIIIHGGANSMMHETHPGMEKHIKVIAEDDGKIEILEDGELIEIEKMEEGEKVIEKDGKKIVIKKIKNGDEVEINVEVEEKEEKQ